MAFFYRLNSSLQPSFDYFADVGSRFYSNVGDLASGAAEKFVEETAAIPWCNPFRNCVRNRQQSEYYEVNEFNSREFQSGEPNNFPVAEPTVASKSRSGRTREKSKSRTRKEKPKFEIENEEEEEERKEKKNEEKFEKKNSTNGRAKSRDEDESTDEEEKLTEKSKKKEKKEKKDKIMENENNSTMEIEEN